PSSRPISSIRFPYRTAAPQPLALLASTPRNEGLSRMSPSPATFTRFFSFGAYRTAPEILLATNSDEGSISASDRTPPNTPSAHTLRPGSVSRSRRIVLAPEDAAFHAAITPAGPAPITVTSQDSKSNTQVDSGQEFSRLPFNHSLTVSGTRLPSCLGPSPLC